MCSSHDKRYSKMIKRIKCVICWAKKDHEITAFSFFWNRYFVFWQWNESCFFNFHFQIHQRPIFLFECICHSIRIFYKHASVTRKIKGCSQVWRDVASVELVSLSHFIDVRQGWHACSSNVPILLHKVGFIDVTFHLQFAPNRPHGLTVPEAKSCAPIFIMSKWFSVTTFLYVRNTLRRTLRTCGTGNDVPQAQCRETSRLPRQISSEVLCHLSPACVSGVILYPGVIRVLHHATPGSPRCILEDWGTMILKHNLCPEVSFVSCAKEKHAEITLCSAQPSREFVHAPNPTRELNNLCNTHKMSISLVARANESERSCVNDNEGAWVIDYVVQQSAAERIRPDVKNHRWPSCDDAAETARIKVWPCTAKKTYFQLGMTCWCTALDIAKSVEWNGVGAWRPLLIDGGPRLKNMMPILQTSDFPESPVGFEAADVSLDKLDSQVDIPVLTSCQSLVSNAPSPSPAHTTPTHLHALELGCLPAHVHAHFPHFSMVNFNSFLLLAFTSPARVHKEHDVDRSKNA